MNLGNKIKALRINAGCTQEVLAKEFGVSFQTISKWENNVCAPDIELLPKISVYFGISIDELFDLTADERLHRIENMLDMEQEISDKTFEETISFLKQQLEVTTDKAKIYNFLAHVYHHRMESDSVKVSMYAKKALKSRPDIKNCQWLLQKADGAAVRDWVVKNHNNIIEFYKELVNSNPDELYNYLELIDNLLADNRVNEAEKYLSIYNNHKNCEKFRVLYYEWKIAYANHDKKMMKEKLKQLEEEYAGDGTAIFLAADLYADSMEFEKAISYYEKSFELDKKQEKTLYTDALESIALIYQIEGQYENAVKYYDKILIVLDEYFGFKEGAPVEAIIERRNNLLKKMKQ